MIVTIHRGSHQIGGCATEIRTENSRILIEVLRCKVESMHGIMGDSFASPLERILCYVRNDLQESENIIFMFFQILFIYMFAGYPAFGSVKR